ncbi:MAG: IS110 family transposase [Thermodesulfobacteriota bacterium]
MERYKERYTQGKEIYVGIDLHKKSWHVTVISEDTELYRGSIPGIWEALRSLLQRYKGSQVRVVYEAGCFGFWLYDHIVDWGADCVVTPPSLIPREYGNRVKTDRRDSRKLAHLLSKGLLKRVWVPSEEERYHRQVTRRRRQLIRDRTRVQCRIKSDILCYGLYNPESQAKWSKAYVEKLHRICFNDYWMQESFEKLLNEYEFLSEQIYNQTRLLNELSQTKRYKKHVKILRSIHGIGMISAMEILLELQDMSRFRRAGQISAYLGLTPSQYSSGEKIRMGRITGIGKSSLRGILIESSWILIRKDGAMKRKYEQIKTRAGSKRAIVAIARTLLLRIRRMLLDNTEYAPGLIA